MELRQLRYFVSAAKHLNFTKAAAECCVVQSAMSQQITALERELGATLFERTNRGLSLTPEGEAMEREAIRLLAQAERVREAVEQARDGCRSQLRIGRCGGLLYEALPQALTRFHNEYPGVRVQLGRIRRETQLNELENGDIDCLITLWEPLFGSLDQLDMRILGEEALCAMLPKDHPLAGEKRLTAQQLSGDAMLFNCESAGERGDTPQTLMDDAEALIRGGYGYALCLRSAARPCAGVVYREVVDKEPGRACMLWRRGSQMNDMLDRLSSLLVMLQSE